MATPTVSPFTPPACVLGTGVGLLAGLCSFSCNFGYCPMNACVSRMITYLPPSQFSYKFTKSTIYRLALNKVHLMYHLKQTPMLWPSLQLGSIMLFGHHSVNLLAGMDGVRAMFA